MHVIWTIAISDPGSLSRSFMQLRCAKMAELLEVLLGVGTPEAICKTGCKLNSETKFDLCQCNALHPYAER